MPSKNMLPKGNRRQSVKEEYRAHRTALQEQMAAKIAAGVVDAEDFEPVTYDTAEMYATPSPFAGRPGLVMRISPCRVAAVRRIARKAERGREFNTQSYC